jgi:hypothetical protein
MAMPIASNRARAASCTSSFLISFYPESKRIKI